jgi:hypothetical protein
MRVLACEKPVDEICAPEGDAVKRVFSLVGLSFAGLFLLAGCGGSGSSSRTSPLTPTVQWATPTPVVVGSQLSSVQLDATATAPGGSTPIPGAFVYSPAAGTLLNTAGNVTLSVTFYPSNNSTYTSASATVTLAVDPPATPTIQWSTPAAVPVGTALSSTQLDAVAVVPGTSTQVAGSYTYTPAAGTVLTSAGTQTLSVTFTPTDTMDYTSATASVAITVTQATPVIQWATPAAIYVGTALSSTQLDATATAPGSSSALAGTFVYTPPAGTVLSTLGTQTLSVTFTPTDTADYTSASASVSITVNAIPPPSYTWNNVRIVGGGFVTGIVMHPAQKGLMYARTDVGGAYRYDSATSTWIPLTDWITRANDNLVGIESIGIDPSDPTKLYLAAGTYADSFGSNGAMLVSSDQGNTFTVVNLPIKLGSNDNGRNAGERLAVDPNLGSTIYFGSRNNGLWRSTDSGSTWSQVTSFPVSAPTSGVGVVFEDFIASTSTSGSATKTIYAGVSATGTGSDPKSLYVSNDAGATWSAVPGAPTGLYVTHGVLGPDGNLYFTFGDQVGPAGLTTGKIYQYVLPTTNNPNGTWNDITPPRANGYQGGYGAVTLDPEKPGTIMVSTLDHYYPVGDDLWRSNNYGQSWYSINTVGANRDASLSPWLYYGTGTVTNTGNWVATMQIDPFDSNHVVHGTGGTIWTTDDITVSDSGQPSNWTVGALGVEETVIEGLISPPLGPANLLSIMGDLGGFQHTDLTVSPANGANSNPRLSTGTSIDFAQSTPQDVVWVGYGSNSQFGGYSTDSGADWTPFASNPPGVSTGAGNVAMSADGSTILWAPLDNGVGPYYSTDNGTTWTACSGATAHVPIVADRVNAKVFYVYNSSAGILETSTDGGKTFTTTQTGLPTGGTLNAAYDAQGDLWLVSSSGIYHTTTGSNLTLVSGVQSAWGIAFGMSDTGSNFLTIYLGGQIAGQEGIYRSTDGGNSWIRIDDAAHEYGNINAIQADPRVFGRVYLGTGGRGIIYGDSQF